MNSCRIAVIGATGAVGSVFLGILESRGFPASQIRLCASERSWGRKMSVMGEELVVEGATASLLGEVDLVFVCAGSDVSRDVAPLAVQHGATVIDKSSAFRMDPDVPLVVPEVNGGDLEKHQGMIATPNCSTVPLVMTIQPLMGASEIERVTVATYQSVSGTGAAAMEELRVQSSRALNGGRILSKEYPHQIAFNVFPHVESFGDDGHTTEEMKMVHESRKILHQPDLRISATCARVPVMIGHSEAVYVDFHDEVGADDVRGMLACAPGVTVVDDPSANRYPTPMDAAGRDDILVGRIRQDVSDPRRIAMWIAADNLRKGAALNGIQIAEELLRRDLLHTTARRI